MKQFFKDMFSNENGVSSKRVNGTIGFLSTIAIIAIWRRDATEMLLATSAMLIGLQSVIEIFKAK